MIIIIFIALAIVYFLVQHFENQRKERNEDRRERRRDAFMNLLHALKNEKKDTDHSNNQSNET
jgi:FtsZ-interacting cell division protein ZipA